MRHASNNPHAIAGPEDAAQQEAQERDRTGREEKAREVIVDEVRDRVGDEGAARAERKLRAEGIETERAGLTNAVRSPLFLYMTVSAVVIGVTLTLATDSWIWLLVALGAHAVGTIIIVISGFAYASDDTDKPSPTAEARLTELGVKNQGEVLDRATDAAPPADTDKR